MKNSILALALIVGMISCKKTDSSIPISNNLKDMKGCWVQASLYPAWASFSKYLRIDDNGNVYSETNGDWYSNTVPYTKNTENSTVEGWAGYNTYYTLKGDSLYLTQKSTPFKSVYFKFR